VISSGQEMYQQVADMTQNTAVIEVDTTIDEGRWTSFQTATVLICGIVTLIDGFDAQSIGFVAPVLAKQWGVAPAAFGPVFSASLVGMMIGALSLGPIADRFGRKIAAILAITFMGVFTLASAKCTSVESLMVVRLLTGIGLGGALPNCVALSGEYAPARWRATAIGAMFCGFPLGAMLGGLLSARIIPAFGWESVFYVGGSIPLILIPILAVILPESIRYLVVRRKEPKRILSLLHKIAPEVQATESNVFVVREDTGAGVAISELFSHGRLLGTLMLWISVFANILLYYFLINWLPLLLQQAGLSLSNAILLTALLNFGGIVGTIVFARSLDRAGNSRILIWAFLGCTVFTVMLGYAGANIPMLVVAVFLAGFCANGALNNLSAVAANLYPTNVRATGIGWALGFGRVGSIIGPMVGTWLLLAKVELAHLFTIIATPSLFAAVAMYVLNMRPSEAATTPVTDTVRTADV
jgi:MFS transporter, AAHS family, 4-hydroxybenzoate transporter